MNISNYAVERAEQQREIEKINARVEARKQELKGHPTSDDPFGEWNLPRIPLDEAAAEAVRASTIYEEQFCKLALMRAQIKIEEAKLEEAKFEKEVAAVSVNIAIHGTPYP